MPAVRILLLVLGSVAVLVPWRFPAFLPVAGLAAAAVALRIAPWTAVRSTVHDLGPALVFLALAVPLAVVLDATGYFAEIAARLGAGRHLLVWLWVLAAGTTIVFNLDAAVVLLTPLYVRIAVTRRLPVVHVAMIPALLASLASSVLPVSNLTNLIAAERLGLTAREVLAHLALPSLAAIVVGGVLHLRRRSVEPSGPPSDPVDGSPRRPRVLALGHGVVGFLLVGFTVGDHWGIPAWAVAGAALSVLMVVERRLPWRDLPIGAVAVATSLGVLAAAAAPHLATERVLALRGVGGTFATVGVMTVAANAVNNLPALLLSLPGLSEHRDAVWPVLIGVNIGPTLWVTGALSTLLWQSTMARLGHPVGATTYARHGIRVGVPALLIASIVLLPLR